MKSLRNIEIFVSSPGDLSEERDLVVEICEEINRDVGRLKNFRLEAVRWETHAVSGVAERSQEVINEQIGKYDIYIGLMGYYFGSATGSYKSGTEEEFRIAFDRFNGERQPIIQFYFSGVPVDPSLLDMTQYERVKEFKESVGREGLYYKIFKDLIQLKVLCRQGIYDAVFQLLESEEDSMKFDDASAKYSDLKPYESLKNFKEKFSNNAIVSVHFLTLEATKRLKLFADRLIAANKKLTNMNSSVVNATKKLHALNVENRSSLRGAVKALEHMSEHMDELVYWLSMEIDKMEKDFMAAMSSFQRAALISLATDAGEGVDASVALGAAKSLRSQLEILGEAARRSSGAFAETAFEQDFLVRLKGGALAYQALAADFADFIDRAVTTIDQIEQRLAESLQQA